MPENTISVTRPGRWGNPYRVDVYGLILALQLYRNTVNGIWNPSLMEHCTDAVCDAAYKTHHDFLKRFGCPPLECLSELRGKNLACWCGEGAACHRDWLLEVANKELGGS